MVINDDESFLRRAIRLAMNGRGSVEPNPMVGCLLVKNGRIIGEGFHAIIGGAHAEPNALASCTEDPRGATAYVTLEPCCHTDKKTPPCAPRLIAAGISRVVIGCLDPNPKVNGNGVAMLREAGIHVDRSPLESACRQLIAPFLLREQSRRPYITLKWAQTADGAVAGANGKPIQITDDRSTRIVHELRSRCDAIVVGINTVLSDDPFLTARGVKTQRPLLRYVLDRSLRIPLDSRLVKSAEEFPLIVACRNASGEKAAELTDRGVTVIQAPDFEAVLRDQFNRGVTHVLVEPGPTLAAA
ncbi:MAG: bifunctional diaminohydroxyphosphoribosylaminopyrimidine deaminase/5-amino-6-(5-phosphoribosylamino)uracil reductase RibD, partial [Phycisphaerae bacterium]|nr:bifunctional diaminohydroxyphosphoribosylaminopyrimidine deaminase/5-amino-6-(5-phosphoribosylamino)uracil reductase RibD [Phycisphaerae bacterium]